MSLEDSYLHSEEFANNPTCLQLVKVEAKSSVKDACSKRFIAEFILEKISLQCLKYRIHAKRHSSLVSVVISEALEGRISQPT
jgi:hypothetical protein